MAAMRWLAAGSLLALTLSLRGERLPARGEWPALLVLGILLLGFGNGAVSYAEQTVPSGLTAVLIAAAPFWMVGVERLMGADERLTVRRLAGLAIGFGGIVLLVWPDLQVGAGGSRGFPAGVAATQMACCGWAIGSSYARRRPVGENVLAAASIQMILAGAVLLAVGLAMGEWSRMSFNPRTLGALLYLVLAGSVIGYSSYAYALKHLPISTVSLYAYVNPVIAVLLGTIVLSEPLSPRIEIAGLIVFAGSWLVKRS
jgi:drug/metabolite transporter (DMT)-like permease